MTYDLARQKINEDIREKIFQVIDDAKDSYPESTEKYPFIYNTLKFGKEFEGQDEHIDQVKAYLKTTDVVTFLSKIYDIPNC